MLNIADNLTQVKKLIQASAKTCGRNSSEITLLAASKTQTANVIASAYKAGQRHFGENYLQEALDKIAALRTLDLTWHFIGHVQSNKSRAVAENFAWVHTLDSLKLAQRLSQQRPTDLPPLHICIQINIDNQVSKNGCHPQEAFTLAEAVCALPRLHLRGLMAIPSPDNTPAAFETLATLKHTINAHLAAQTKKPHRHLDTLSMGMSQDMTQAIEAGATCLRIGTAIFGKRKTDKAAT